MSAAASGALSSTPVSIAGEGSFVLCAAPSVLGPHNGTQPAKQPPGSLLEALAKQLAEAERPSGDSSAAVSLLRPLLFHEERTAACRMVHENWLLHEERCAAAHTGNTAHALQPHTWQVH